MNPFLMQTMKECISDIKLPRRPIELDSQRENNPYCRRLDDRTKCFLKIYTILLMKPLSNQPSLIPTDNTITVMFELKHPFAANNILRG